MGSLSSKVNPHDYMPFLIERQLVSEPVIIMLGIGRISDTYSIKKQCIKINEESKLHCLLHFVETHNSLTYDFEDNIKLTIMKTLSSDICNIYYNLRTDSLNISDKLSDNDRRWFKTININSEQLDKLADFIKYI
jgi:hypothetical protein